MRAGEHRAVAVVHETQNGGDGEVAELTAVSGKRTSRSGTSWCGGEVEGDLRRPKVEEELGEAL